MQRDPLRKLLKSRDFEGADYETGEEYAESGMRKRLILDGDIKLSFTDGHKH